MRRRVIFAGGLLMLGLACGRPGADPWGPPAQATSPCLEVDLANGLDDGEEVGALFDCLDYHGHLAPLRPAATALQVQRGDGTSAADQLAQAQRAGLDAGLDPLEGATAMATWLQQPDAPSQAVLDSVAELLTGQTATVLRQQGEDTISLDASPLAAFSPRLPQAAATLAAEPAALEELAGLIDGEALPHWLATLSHASEAAAVDGWLSEAGTALGHTTSPGNDVHPGATGDSLRDVIDTWWLRDDAVLEQLAPTLAPLLGSVEVQGALVEALAEAQAEDALEAAPGALAWLAATATDGNPSTSAEPSALARLVRLLGTTNGPIDCELDLWITSFTWSFPNLSVRMMQIIAQLEPGTIQNVAGVLSALGDSALTEALLDAAISTGTCPSITAETLDDMEALVLLQEPEAEPLLIVTIELLAAFDDIDRLPDVADAVTVVHDSGGLPPIEELLRDIGPTRAAGGFARLLGALATPVASNLPADVGTLGDLLDSASALLAAPPRYYRWRTVARAFLDGDEGWEAMARLGRLVEQPDSELAHLLELVRDIQTHDPDLELFRVPRAWLADPAIVEPVLLVLQEAHVVDPLFAESTDEGPAPLAWAAHRLTNGTLLDLVDRLSTALDQAGYASARR